ncbi:maleylpyruvate isomerase N-terminal domain-containing protein [Actinoplanes sp. NEAU-A12]|uniref:Maleylpyruvate isomerase N-terminal domain-containing protein n=1 Tax=Actinoplanes sandaracinus TaxID=3045177 RepID=A0ABT6WZE8_9ACTN|nr:maleylpyruvate isomerase N-terminal domain-containing protein [Actinoplanes sandaracinus]MDI6105117.1 maleylpyruvate isomerase N-terminal domain-containing protein [Actinoplanes sandaracinus]
METNLEFSDLLRLIDERSAAFRAAVASAPSLDVPVPTCPGWTLFDLVQHIDVGRRFWAAIVTAGPADAPPAKPVSAAPREREALLEWLAAATRELLDALREAGPDRGCWTWWGGSQSPQTSGAVARHQLQEVAVHTYDAQLAVGDPQPLPSEVALDGVDEFLSTCCAGPYSWPYDPAVVEYHATEGRSWRLSLSADGVRAVDIAAAADDAEAAASLKATAGELVLALYGRVALDSLKLDGDGRVFDLLLAWDPDE